MTVKKQVKFIFTKYLGKIMNIQSQATKYPHINDLAAVRKWMLSGLVLWYISVLRRGWVNPCKPMLVTVTDYRKEYSADTRKGGHGHKIKSKLKANKISYSKFIPGEQVLCNVTSLVTKCRDAASLLFKRFHSTSYK